MTTAIQQHMINLGPAAAVPLGEGRRYRVERQDIAIFRPRSGSIFATQAQCPHRGGPLADGLVGAGTVICPLHNFKFAFADGQPVNGECDALKTYPVTVSQAGDILLTLEG